MFYNGDMRWVSVPCLPPSRLVIFPILRNASPSSLLPWSLLPSGHGNRWDCAADDDVLPKKPTRNSYMSCINSSNNSSKVPLKQLDSLPTCLLVMTVEMPTTPSQDRTNTNTRMHSSACSASGIDDRWSGTGDGFIDATPTLPKREVTSHDQPKAMAQAA